VFSSLDFLGSSFSFGILCGAWSFMAEGEDRASTFLGGAGFCALRTDIVVSKTNAATTPTPKWSIDPRNLSGGRARIMAESFLDHSGVCARSAEGPFAIDRL